VEIDSAGSVSFDAVFLVDTENDPHEPWYQLQVVPLYVAAVDMPTFVAAATGIANLETEASGVSNDTRDRYSALYDQKWEGQQKKAIKRRLTVLQLELDSCLQKWGTHGEPTLATQRGIERLNTEIAAAETTPAPVWTPSLEGELQWLIAENDKYKRRAADIHARILALQETISPLVRAAYN
jgi:hypothetical protein